jgi:hypothetical protein
MITFAMAESLSSEIEYHPLAGLWLVRKSVRAPHIDHFKSVMDCADHGEASRLAHDAGKRFDGDYIIERQAIEAWIREEALAKGLTLPDAPPLYFYLYPQPIMTTSKDRLLINIPAHTVPVNAMTFTVEDSFHNYAQLQGRPNGDFGIEPAVLTAHEIAAKLKGAFPEHLDGRVFDRYIEGQLWQRDISALRLGQEAVAVATAGPGVVLVSP